MLKRLLIGLVLALLALPAGAQLPGGTEIQINRTPVVGGTALQCLYVTSTGKVGNQACTTGSVTTFSGSATGLTPATPTSGAITLGGVLVGANGGTGVANTGKTITLGGNLTTDGALSLTAVGPTTNYLSGSGSYSSGIRVLCSGGNSPTLSGTTAETTLITCTVPGGTMGANGALRVTAMFEYTNSVNTKSLRVRWGGLTTGIQCIGVNQTTTTAYQNLTIVRNLNSVSSQQCLHASNPYNQTQTTDLLHTLNTATDQTILFTGQLDAGGSAGGDTVKVVNYLVELVPGV